MLKYNFTDIFSQLYYEVCHQNIYPISGSFRVGLIFAEFATSLKSPKIDTAKNKPYYTSSLRNLEIAKIGLGENLTHLPSVFFAKISRREKFPIYGMTLQNGRRYHGLQAAVAREGIVHGRPSCGHARRLRCFQQCQGGAGSDVQLLLPGSQP